MQVYVKKISQFILIISLFASIQTLQAQVTIGAGTPPSDFSVLELSTQVLKGGFRLPQLTTVERNAITDDPSFKEDKAMEGRGLVIYNTSTQCIDYWNNESWVSICEGNSQMTIAAEPCTTVAADGTGCDNEFKITDPDCTTGPFHFSIVAGNDYAFLKDIDEGNGTFKIDFQSNNSIYARSVIVRITSTCTGLYKDFLFTQVGQQCNPALSEVPEITSMPAAILKNGKRELSYCAGGAVFLSIPLDSPENLENIIWTRNNIEIARGVNNIVVTQAGTYNVYKGIIGCSEKKGNAIIVTKSGTGTPDPVQVIVKGNNGIACGAGGTVTLIVQKPTGSGTVRWFKNGILMPVTTPDNQVEAGAGEWFAVVNDGTCWSKTSEIVSVLEDLDLTDTSLTKPVIDKSGSFCQGSTIQLFVNTTSYNPSYTYTWYENNTQIGVGQYIMYNVPSGTPSVVIRCRATKPGSCAAEGISSETISVGTIPPHPLITGNTVLCSGAGTLNVIPVNAGTYTYAWYKDNLKISNEQSLNISSAGDYYATVTEVGGCTSALAHRYIGDVTSATPTITLNSSSQNPNLNDVVTFAATIDFPPVTSYKWTLENAIFHSGGSDGPNAVVKFPYDGLATVRIEISNACGTSSKTFTVANVTSACADPKEVFPGQATSVTTIVGQGKTLGPVSATFASGTPTHQYQWFKNTVSTTIGGTQISGATSNTYVANEPTAGTYYYYCEVSNGSCASATMPSGVFTVIVSPNPEILLPGSGTFTGKTYFDINKSNHVNGCGIQESRNSSMVNFATLGPVNYTFTASANGIKRDLRFMIVDNEDCVESYSGGKAGIINNSEQVILTVNYKKTLSLENSNPKIWGRKRNEAAKVRIYAVYNDGTKDVSLPLTINIQDCICCPGYLAVGGAENGKDLCFYKTDGNKGRRALYTTGFRGCRDAKEGYIDAEYATLGEWRLPTIDELKNIHAIAPKLSSQPTSSHETTNMLIEWYMGGKVESSDLYNAWGFYRGLSLILHSTTETYVRCVREF